LLDLHAYDQFDGAETASKGHSHLDPVSLRYLILLRMGLGVADPLRRRYRPSPSQWDLSARTSLNRSTAG
jgi:hypothetical protein